MASREEAEPSRGGAPTSVIYDCQNGLKLTAPASTSTCSTIPPANLDLVSRSKEGVQPLEGRDHGNIGDRSLPGSNAGLFCL